MEFINENKILTRNGTVELINEKYILFTIHDHITTLQIDRLKEIVKAFHHFCSVKRYPLLMIANSIDKLGNEEEKLIRDSSKMYFNSQALVTSNRFTIMVINMALMLKSSPIPTKLFSDEQAALQWMEKYMQ